MIIGVADPYSAETAEQRQINLDAMNIAAYWMLQWAVFVRKIIHTYDQVTEAQAGLNYPQEQITELLNRNIVNGYL
jgi:hypothetical protein